MKLLTLRKSILTIGGYGGYDTYHVFFQEEDKVTIITTIWCEPPVEKTYSKEETAFLLDKFKSVQVEFWNSEYTNTTICDGTQWKFFVKNKDQRVPYRKGAMLILIIAMNSYLFLVSILI